MLGTGLMGEPMAIRLLAAGHDLVAWNRTREKTREVASAGARIVGTPADAVPGADVVIVILENGPVVEEVVFGQGVANAMSPNTILADMSSIAPHHARAHHARLCEYGIAHLDAPVSGGPGGARAGTLAIMVGGDEATFEAARPVFSVLGRPTRVGPSGAGQLAKLCSQMLTATAIEAVAEVLTFAAAAGADPVQVREALTGGFADSQVLRVHGGRMLARDFVPGGHVRTFVKDLKAALAIAEEQRLTLPVAQLAASIFTAFDEDGGGDHDISAIILDTERRNPAVQR